MLEGNPSTGSVRGGSVIPSPSALGPLHRTARLDHVGNLLDLGQHTRQRLEIGHLERHVDRQDVITVALPVLSDDMLICRSARIPEMSRNNPVMY